MARVIPFRYTAASTAPRAAWLPAALRVIVARLEAAFRGPVVRGELCGLPEWQLRDIGLSRVDVGCPGDTRLAILRGSDRAARASSMCPGLEVGVRSIDDGLCSADRLSRLPVASRGTEKSSSAERVSGRPPWLRHAARSGSRAA